ncbi:MAG: hypothetical protein JHC87_07565 [Thermoleophilaceae bacterium]|nr:hypothetical protein [Thermoleophilaceae bacterium]
MPAIRFARISLIAFAVLAALSLSACGTSKEDKALASVCSSKADIQKQVTALKGLTISTASANQVNTSITAITDDLKNIKDQIPVLKDSVKPQVEQANNEFKSALTGIALELGKSLSLEQGGEQATAALTQLGTAYEQAFASLDCPAS